MSADRVGSECPACKAEALREYYDIGLKATPDGFVLVADYQAVCKACNWSVDRRFKDEPLAIESMK